MALTRLYNYVIQHKGRSRISVETFPDVKNVTLTQAGGGYHDEADRVIHISFEQLVDLINALQEIRTHHVPHEWTAD